jgi:hypothetical protein
MNKTAPVVCYYPYLVNKTAPVVCYYPYLVKKTASVACYYPYLANKTAPIADLKSCFSGNKENRGVFDGKLHVESGNWKVGNGKLKLYIQH